MDAALHNGADFQMWVTFAIIVATFALYAYDKIAIEVTSLGVLSVLMVFFHVFPMALENGANEIGRASCRERV